MICGLSDVPAILGALTVIVCALILGWSFGSVRASARHRADIKSALRQLDHMNGQMATANQVMDKLQEIAEKNAARQ
ncbi:hypothetical protein D3C84_830290 [compost metagenome]